MDAGGRKETRVLTEEDQSELKRGYEYVTKAEQAASSHTDFTWVHAHFENARACFRRITDLEVSSQEITATYIREAQICEQTYHQHAEAQVLYGFARRRGWSG